MWTQGSEMGSEISDLGLNPPYPAQWLARALTSLSSETASSYFLLLAYLGSALGHVGLSGT